MTNLFFTADLHLCHNKEFLYQPRGFSSVEEMNEAIVERWNAVVKSEDIVYLLGDTMLNDNTCGLKYFKRLNGQIFLIYGNHDTDTRKNLFFTELSGKMLGGVYAWLIKHGKLSIYMSHYPTITSNWDQKHFSQHVINLHGHIHSRTPWINLRNPFMYDVGMDAHKCTPVHIDEIMSDIRQKWEEIGRLPTPVIPEDNYPYNRIFI